jgi:hypothetical protein
MNQFSYIVYTARVPSFLTAKTGGNDSFVLFESSDIAYYASIIAIACSGGTKHVIHMNDLESNRYYLKEPIEVTISDLGNEVLAEFLEAEISVSEDTASDALSWLKDRIVGSYIRFKSQRDKLGPLPMRQLQVLERYIDEG